MTMPDQTQALIPEKDAVLVLTRNAILSMDLEEALENAGFPPHTSKPRDLCRAVIVDLDALDRRRAALARRHGRAGVPVFAIAYDHAAACRIAGSKVVVFKKPIDSEIIVREVKRLTARAD